MREEEGSTVSAAPSGLKIFEVTPDPQQGVVGYRRSREKKQMQTLCSEVNSHMSEVLYQSQMPCALRDVF